MFSRRIVRISILVAVALWLQQPAAFGQPADAIEKVTQLNREAVAAVDKREFEKARELLKRALDLCKTSGLEGHPAAARTHIHMGVVIIQGFKNHDLGMKQFAKALAIDPNITITKSLSTPPLEEAFAEAKALRRRGRGRRGRRRRAPGTAPDRRAPPAETRTEAPSSSGFSYHTVSEVKQGSSIVVTVTIEDSLKFRKLILAYREQGTSEFLGREMEPVGDGAYRAEIPASATSGSSVAYYMEAQDDAGNSVGSRGTETRPLVISFAATAKPSSARAEATVEKKTEKRRRDEDDEEGGGKYFVGLLVGSGIGYTSGNGEVNADVPVSGTASGALLGHVAPEFGTWWHPNLLLSLQGRFQIRHRDDGADEGRPQPRPGAGGAGGVRQGDLVRGRERAAPVRVGRPGGRTNPSRRDVLQPDRLRSRRKSEVRRFGRRRAAAGAGRRRCFLQARRQPRVSLCDQRPGRRAQVHAQPGPQRRHRLRVLTQRKT